ncbi:MAG: hypothetical protein IJ958_11780 [Agathobacter sp.]|nr:hypothetical protein [Agathobacter sp.]
MAETNFVTIELSRKQVDFEHPVYNEKMQKNYLRIYAPEGGIIFYPAKSIKVRNDNPEVVFFTRPEGTVINVNYSELVEGAPENAPAEEKYKNTTKPIKIEDLKEMFEESRRMFIENNGFVNMMVPTEWGKKFTSNDDKNFVSISIPIKENEKDVYYSFILPEERFKESEKMEGMSYFGFPKKFKGPEGMEGEPADYVVTLKTSVLQGDSTYADEFKAVTSKQLKEYVDAALERYNVSELFVSVEISEKLVRHFESKEQKALVSVSVPVYENDDKAVFYDIVLPAGRVKESEHAGKVVLSMFKKNPGGEAYEFTGKRSVLKAGTTDQYEDIKKKMTSEDVVNYFQESAAKYKANDTHSIEDELSGAYTMNTSAQNENNPFRRPHGR